MSIHRHALSVLTGMAKDRYDAVHHPRQRGTLTPRECTIRYLEAMRLIGCGELRNEHHFSNGKCTFCGKEYNPITEAEIKKDMEIMEPREREDYE